MCDWYRLQWYGVLAIGTAFAAGSFYILVAKREPFAWIALSFGLVMVAMAMHELWPRLIEGRPVPPDDMLQRFPGRVILQTPRAKLIFFLGSTLLFGFSLTGMALYSDMGVLEKAIMWIGAVGCAAAVPAFLLAILRGPTLRLDADAMHVSQGPKSSTHRWADVSVFSVVDVGMRMVIFDDATMSDGGVVQFNRGMIGRGGGLPDNYGMAPEQLAWLLNEWRARALSRDATRPPRSQSPPAP
jgi:hypothetical protein